MPCFEYEVYDRLKLIQVLGQALGHLNQRNTVVGTSDGSTVVWAFLQEADAWLARPVGTRELLARIASLLRRCYWNGETRSVVSLDADQISQIYDQLTRIEAHLFRHLLVRRERLVPQKNNKS